MQAKKNRRTASPVQKAGKPTIYSARRLGAIAVRWDARALGWDRALADPTCHLNEDAAYERFLTELRAVLMERAAFCRSQGVVDAGCGTGLVLAQAATHFAWGIGVDISPKMIRAAKRKRIRKSRFIVGDCFELSRICPPAGAILSRGVLLSHYGSSQAKALLREARRALVPGGFLMCDFLNRPARSKFRHRPEQKIYFSGSAARQLARRAGFTSSRVLGQPDSRVLILLLER